MGRIWIALGARRTRLVSGLAMCFCVLAGVASAAQAATTSDQAVAYQVDPAHDGSQSADQLSMPLSQLWSVQLPGTSSYPLIAGGIVYVSAYNAGGSGTTLYAIDLSTGATLWYEPLSGASELAYDGGRVFAIDTSGQLTAYDAATGITDWSVSLPGQYMFTSPPTATGGYVYVGGAGSGGTLYAVSESTGTVAWTEGVMNGDHSSPAVGPNGVYVTYACDQDYGFDLLSGAPLWQHSGPCEGGGGKTPVLADGYVFGRDSFGDLILSATTGAQVGTFASTTAPAVANGLLYTMTGGTLTAVSQDGLGPAAWDFTGDGQLDSAPIVGGNVVYEGSSTGELYALDAQTGVQLWSGNVGSAINGPDEQNAVLLTGLALGQQTLVVPAGSQLVAYRGAAPPVSNPVTPPPVNQRRPHVLGRPHVGLRIHGNPGGWLPDPTGYSYQWLLCDRDGQGCTLISGATSRFYTPTRDELGLKLRVQVTASDAGGASAPALSPPSRRVQSTARWHRRGHHRGRRGHHRHRHHHGHRRHRHRRHRSR